MKQRLGAILCLLLGSVLIWSGLSTSDTATVGTPPPPTPCGTLTTDAVPAASIVCPTGTINFSEITDGVAPGLTRQVTPGPWTIHVTSDCLDPGTNAPVDQTVVVPNNDNKSTTALFVFADTNSSTACMYAYAEEPVAGYTTTYDKNPPQPIPFGGGQTNSGLKVTVTNTAAGSSTSSSSPVSTSPAPSTSAVTTATATATPVPSASSSAALAVTGPKRTVSGSLIAGIVLCLLGAALLFAGRRPRAARHRT